METFIQHKDLLLTRNEYAGGDAPSPKVNKDRHKLASKGQIRVITDEKDWEIRETKKLTRK